MVDAPLPLDRALAEIVFDERQVCDRVMLDETEYRHGGMKWSCVPVVAQIRLIQAVSVNAKAQDRELGAQGSPLGWVGFR